MTIAIILARGGSKGLKNKNIINFCGKPLITWTINNCFEAGIKNVYVSSDSKKILNISKKAGAECIVRQKKYAQDYSTSESAWLNALEIIESQGIKSEWIIAPQVTSPLRFASDISKAIKLIKKTHYDSFFSGCLFEDLLIWHKQGKKLSSLNYDWKKRKRRQDFFSQYVENGSFYMFKSKKFKRNGNRLFGKIGVIEMRPWQVFEIDSHEDMKLAEILMKRFILKGKNYK